MATQRQPISRQEIDRGVQLIKANVLAGILGPERIEQLERTRAWTATKLCAGWLTSA